MLRLVLLRVSSLLIAVRHHLLRVGKKNWEKKRSLLCTQHTYIYAFDAQVQGSPTFYLLKGYFTVSHFYWGGA